jgi:hypothetical protein
LFWSFLSVWLFWFGTAMALRGIILGVREENASTRQSENGENHHRGAQVSIAAACRPTILSSPVRETNADPPTRRVARHPH